MAFRLSAKVAEPDSSKPKLANTDAPVWRNPPVEVEGAKPHHQWAVESAMNRAEDFLSNGAKLDRTSELWTRCFGKVGDAEVAEIKSNIEKCQKQLWDSKFKVVDDCDNGTTAYVKLWFGRFHEEQIRLCDNFWSATTNEQAAAIVHELMHLHAGKKDHRYMHKTPRNDTDGLETAVLLNNADSIAELCYLAYSDANSFKRTIALTDDAHNVTNGSNSEFDTADDEILALQEIVNLVLQMNEAVANGNPAMSAGWRKMVALYTSSGGQWEKDWNRVHELSQSVCINVTNQEIRPYFDGSTFTVTRQGRFEKSFYAVELIYAMADKLQLPLDKDRLCSYIQWIGKGKFKNAYASTVGYLEEESL